MSNETAFPVTSDCYKKGMTLRDYFAAKAMHALYTSTFEYVFTGASRTPEYAKLMDELAQDAYQVADSMLKARNGNS